MNEPQAKRRVQALPPSPRPRVTRSAASTGALKARVDLSSVSSSNASSSRASPTPVPSSRLKVSSAAPTYTPTHSSTQRQQPRTLRTQSSTSWESSKQSSPSILAASTSSAAAAAARSPPSSPSARITRTRATATYNPTSRPQSSRAFTHSSVSQTSSTSHKRSNSSASLSASASSISTTSSQQHPNSSVPAVSNISPSTPTSSTLPNSHSTAYPPKTYSTPRLDSKPGHTPSPSIDADGTPRNPYAPATSLLRQKNVPLSPWVSVRPPKQHLHDYNSMSPTLIASGIPLPDSSDESDSNEDTNTTLENGGSNSNGDAGLGLGTDFELEMDPDFDLIDADKMTADEWRTKWKELQLAKDGERRALNRKILDLEIRAASLMSVNTSLEHARERQASELRLLRRRMRRDAPLVRPFGVDGEMLDGSGDKICLNEELPEEDDDEDESEEEEVRIKLMQGDEKFRNAMERIDSMLREAELSVSSNHADSYDGGTIRRAKVRVSEEFS